MPEVKGKENPADRGVRGEDNGKSVTFTERSGERNALIWDAKTGKEYIFEVEQVLKPALGEDGQRSHKGVYAGRFIGGAPSGVEEGTMCCLKRIRTQRNADRISVSAQARERYDLVGFQGPHIRKVLAKCENAEAVEADLRRKGDCDQTVCYSVEPLYIQLKETDECIEALTPWERLDYIWQYGMGIQELTAPENTIGGKRIDALRDVKICNGLIERGYDSFTVRVDDLATIHLDNEPAATRSASSTRTGDHRAPSGTSRRQPGTIKFPLSAENTAPENILSEYPVTGKVDVYALGTMLASMFGKSIEDHRHPEKDIRNPGEAWGNTVCDWEADEGEIIQKRMSEAFADWAKKDVAKDPEPGNSWMERALEAANRPFEWACKGYVVPENILQEIKELFTKATRIDPEKRIGLKEFTDRVQLLRDRVPKQRSFNEYLYIKPVSVYLYDLAGAIGQKVAYEAETRIALAASRKGFPVKCVSYALPSDEGMVNDKEAKLPWDSAWNRDELLKAVRKLSVLGTKTGNSSLTEALANMGVFFRSYSAHERFSGEIHIFTTREFTDEGLCNVELGGVRYACQDIRRGLRNLAGSLSVYVHCPEKPAADDSWFTWVPMDRLLINRPGSDPGKGKEAPRRDPQKGGKAGTGAQAAEPAGKKAGPAPGGAKRAPGREGAEPQKQNTSRRQSDARRDFVINSEGLCFRTGDGMTVYVSKRLRR